MSTDDFVLNCQSYRSLHNCENFHQNLNVFNLTPFMIWSRKSEQIEPTVAGGLENMKEQGEMDISVKKLNIIMRSSSENISKKPLKGEKEREIGKCPRKEEEV